MVAYHSFSNFVGNTCCILGWTFFKYFPTFALLKNVFNFVFSHKSVSHWKIRYVFHIKWDVAYLIPLNFRAPLIFAHLARAKIRGSKFAQEGCAKIKGARNVFLGARKLKGPEFSRKIHYHAFFHYCCCLTRSRLISMMFIKFSWARTSENWNTLIKGDHTPLHTVTFW